MCDDGNIIQGDGCWALCVAEICGDGILQPILGEECDPGAYVAGSGCSASCQVDTDGDTIADAIDNCPEVANPTQIDSDGDKSAICAIAFPENPDNQLAQALADLAATQQQLAEAQAALAECAARPESSARIRRMRATTESTTTGTGSSISPRIRSAKSAAELGRPRLRNRLRAGICAAAAHVAEVANQTGVRAAGQPSGRRDVHSPGGTELVAAAPRDSACEPYREGIERVLEHRRDNAAISRDLVDDNGLVGRYASVNRFARAWREERAESHSATEVSRSFGPIRVREPGCLR